MHITAILGDATGALLAALPHPPLLFGWLTVPVVLAILALVVSAGAAANTCNNQTQTDRGAYDMLLAQLRSACKQGAISVQTNQCTMAIQPAYSNGSMKHFLFYASGVVCDPKKTTSLFFHDDGVLISIAVPDEAVKTHRASMIVSMIDKLMANSVCQEAIYTPQ